MSLTGEGAIRWRKKWRVHPVVVTIAEKRADGLDLPSAGAYTPGMKCEDRKRLLKMALRRGKPGTGGARPVVREKRADYGWAIALPDLGAIRYVIVGGLATALYMPERMTLDTDLLILSEDLAAAETRLGKSGCERMGGLAIGGSSWRLPGGRNLDLLALKQPWVEAAMDASVRDADGHPFVSLPFLVLMKLESGRLQDLADIGRMLGCADENQVSAVQDVIRRYRPQDIEDFQSMLHLGKLEHADG